MSAVEFRGVSKRFAEHLAVDDVSFSVEPGRFVTLLGPSGCGKTTTLRMVAGLEYPTSGQVFVDGRDVTRVSAVERDVTMVFQSYALFPHLTVEQNVSYGLERRRIAQEEQARRLEEGLGLVGLEALGARLPAELSGGQQQRVALARALVLKPKVVLFDEPLSNLDARLRRRMRQDIRRIQKQVGFAAVYVTHDRDEAMAISDEIILMNNGRIEQRGSPDALYARPETEFTARFMSEANVLKAMRTSAGMVIGGIEYAFDGAIDLMGAAIAIHPHALQLSVDGPGWAGEVISRTYLGDRVEYEIRALNRTLVVVEPSDAPRYEEGTRLYVQCAPADIKLVQRSSP